MALALRLRAINDADGALEPRLHQMGPHRFVPERQKKSRRPEIVEDMLVAVRQRGPHAFQLHWLAPIRGGGYRAVSRREPDKRRLSRIALAHQLSHVQFAALPHFRGARVAEM